MVCGNRPAGAQRQEVAPMQGDANVIQGVQLLHVETDGDEVTADLIGGKDPVIMAEIVFRMDDSLEHERLARTFAKWESQATPLTLVQGEDGVITLVDEDGIFESASE
jgi:hypothetical protein